MKQFLICLFSVIVIYASGQQNIDVNLIYESMSGGDQPGYAVEIPQTSLEIVKKEWLKHIQEKTKSKPMELGHEIIIFDVVNKDFSPDPYNIYSLIMTKDTLVYLVAFFEIDSGHFFDPKVDKNALVSTKMDNSIRNYMRGFAVEQYREAVSEELDVEGKKIKDLNGQLKDLKDEQVKIEKNIKSNEQKITSAEEEISMLNTQSTSKIQEVESARLSISEITDPEAEKAAKKELKSLEKERKKIDDQKEKEQKALVGYKSEIKDYESEIDKLTEEQQEIKEKIEAQEDRIDDLEEKLHGIR